jgi:hypothetical protein
MTDNRPNQTEMTSPNSSKLIKEALGSFYRKHDFSEDGGKNEKIVKIKLGKWYFILPNTQGRKRALLFHDIHHVVTGYSVKFKGEAEIGAWEIGSKCKGYFTAFFLDFMAFTVGLFIYPRSVYRAFMRGRHSINLYHNMIEKEALLNMSIKEARTLLKLDISDKSYLTDVFIFVLYILFSLTFITMPIILYLLVGFLI